MDHFTKGRIGFNVVTSYTKNAEDNGLGVMLPHDERSDRTNQCFDIVPVVQPGSHEDFVTAAIPELQWRGIERVSGSIGSSRVAMETRKESVERNSNGLDRVGIESCGR